MQNLFELLFTKVDMFYIATVFPEMMTRERETWEGVNKKEVTKKQSKVRNLKMKIRVII
jgi:chorismate mutase